MDAVYEAVNHKKRPGAGAPTTFSGPAAAAGGGEGPAAGGRAGLGRKESALKLRMRTLETTLASAGSAVDLFAGSKADHSAWDRCGPIIEDAAEVRTQNGGIGHRRRRPRPLHPVGPCRRPKPSAQAVGPCRRPMPRSRVQQVCA